MVLGMDENYEYLQEILLWDPVTENWQVLSQTLLVSIQYLSSRGGMKASLMKLEMKKQKRNKS